MAAGFQEDKQVTQQAGGTQPGGPTCPEGEGSSYHRASNTEIQRWAQVLPHEAPFTETGWGPEAKGRDDSPRAISLSRTEPKTLSLLSGSVEDCHLGPC